MLVGGRVEVLGTGVAALIEATPPAHPAMAGERTAAAGHPTRRILRPLGLCSRLVPTGLAGAVLEFLPLLVRPDPAHPQQDRHPENHSE